MALYFMRHGESSFNVLGLCNDRIDANVCLTPKGREQARAAAEQLAGAGIKRILTSPLPRARETAEIVNTAHGAPIEVHAAIHDWRTGFDGRPVADLYRAIAEDPWHTRLPGGESLAEHHARVSQFLAWLESESRVTTLVIAHEETLRVAAAHFRRLDHAATLALRFANGEIMAIES